MKSCLKSISCAFFIITFSSLGHIMAKGVSLNTSEKLYFIENKGQVKDQYFNPRQDIQYSVQAPGISIFIGNGQVHYQFTKKHMRSVGEPAPDLKYPLEKDHNKMAKTPEKNIQPFNIESYRMDVTLAGANKNAEVIAEDKQAYYENYYIPGCGANGIMAGAYKKITYKNVYEGIDWVIYINGNELENEFVVKPGANPSCIKLQYGGQTSLKINEDGSVTATTPMGMIREKAPVCYNGNGNKIHSKFKLQNNLLSYDVDEYEGALVIDPVLEWGTYYGADSSATFMGGITFDDAGDIYVCGSTACATIGSIATTGSYMATYGGAGNAFLVKFDSSGHRLWGTYFGGNGGDVGTDVAYDHSGNIYLTGFTNSNTGIATPGSYLPFYGGGGGSDTGTDGYLARFTTAGARIWATYIGGGGNNLNETVCCDTSGNIYVGGVTDDYTYIATPGSFKPYKSGPSGWASHGRDNFLQKYDSTGYLHWGTYYGGADDDFGGACATDGNNVYLSGYTVSLDSNSIATPFSYQPVLAGASDAFLAKFDSGGNRLWGTYYGGSGPENTGGVLCSNGYIYLLGVTESDTGIASAGSYQPAIGGSSDAFLAKFDPDSGYRVWGTYFGGPGDEETNNNTFFSADDSGNVYITGYTSSVTGIATTCALQTTNGGGTYDAFLAKYTNDGNKLWSTYYGGSGTDEGWACVVNGNDIYLCGYTNSPDGIATPGSFLDTGGSATFYFQGFLAKLSTCNCPIAIAGIDSVCYDSVIMLSDSMAGGAWSSADTTIATVTGGLVQAKLIGIDTIIYSVANTCANANPEKVIYVTNDCNEAVINIATPGGEITLFPNPTEENITITASVTIRNVVISNLIGQEVYSGSYSSDKVVISLAKLPPGIYIVRVNDSKVYKITKEQ